jgi:hypothetical protein
VQPVCDIAKTSRDESATAMVNGWRSDEIKAYPGLKRTAIEGDATLHVA